MATNDEVSLVNAIAIGIDKDKQSHYAVRWTMDHLAMESPVIVLIHVVHKQNSGGIEPTPDQDPESFFVPFRAYCARKKVSLSKNIHIKEVMLEGDDVGRTIADFITQNLIGAIVVGSSTRNALTRKFKNIDVPSVLMKQTPEFCSVYVISKGKMQSLRTASKSAMVPPSLVPPKIPLASFMNQNEGSRGQSGNGASRTSGHERSNSSLDGSESIFQAFKSSTSYDSSPDGSIGVLSSIGSYEISSQEPDGALSYASTTLSSPKESNSQQQNLEAEMKRLKLELKQTIDMYSTACKEAITAKKQAQELSQWKSEEFRRLEQARLAEETALQIVEMEKAKAKVAIEAAERAQKLAEMEHQKRKHAEMKAKQEAKEKNRALSAIVQHNVQYRKYTIDEIEKGTDKFSGANKIGEGGYGPVYKGKLDHTPVAIKVLRPDAAQGKRQFQQEVEVLSCIRHPNLVLLLGACPEYGCLVYEYLDNGSLEDRLLQKGNTPPIPWRLRFKIAAEMATALLFLHQSKPEPLVHRDLKPANILLDRNYVSKISDVGLARLVPASVADHVTQCYMTSAAGTFCYIDPEYQQTGILTPRSDVYSFGIMLLQVITAKPPMGLAHQVKKAIEKGRFQEILDPSVLDWPIEETLHFAKLALQCAELKKRDRPSLGKVIVPELNRLRDLGNPESHFNTGSSYKSTIHSSISIQPPSSHSQLRFASQLDIKEAPIRPPNIQGELISPRRYGERIAPLSDE